MRFNGLKEGEGTREMNGWERWEIRREIERSKRNRGLVGVWGVGRITGETQKSMQM